MQKHKGEDYKISAVKQKNYPKTVHLNSTLSFEKNLTPLRVT